MFEGSQQVGHGVIQIILDEAHLLNITVKPESQGRGLGLRLLEHLMREAAGHQARECFLEVRASNQAAYRLYERYGFNEIGRRRDYYPPSAARRRPGHGLYPVRLRLAPLPCRQLAITWSSWLAFWHRRTLTSIPILACIPQAGPFMR